MQKKKKVPNENITLKENNRIIRDQGEVAETLNGYFTNYWFVVIVRVKVVFRKTVVGD